MKNIFFDRSEAFIKRYKELVIRIPVEHLQDAQVSIEYPKLIYANRWPERKRVLRANIPQQTTMHFNVEGEWQYQLIEREQEDLSYVELAQK